MLNNGFIMVESYNLFLNLYRRWRKGGRTRYCVDTGNVSELSELCGWDLPIGLSLGDAVCGTPGPRHILVSLCGSLQGHWRAACGTQVLDFFLIILVTNSFGRCLW